MKRSGLNSNSGGSSKKAANTIFRRPRTTRPELLLSLPRVIGILRKQKSKQTKMQLLAGSCWSNEHDLIFTNGLEGVLSYQTVYDCFKQIVEKIGTASSRFHDLRHHYTVVALQSGDDMKTMQENLGHHAAAFTFQDSKNPLKPLSFKGLMMAGGNNSEPWIYKSLAPQRLQNSVPSLA